MVVDELRPVVGVDAPQAEGQRLPDLLQGRLDAGFAAAEDRPGLDPRRVDVGDVERVRELAVARSAAWATRSSSVKPGDGHVPVIGLQRDVVLEQGPRLGAPVPPGRELPLGRRQAPIDLARADGPQLLAHRGRQPEPAAGPGQPQREQRLQPHGPGIARGLPDRGQGLDHRRAVRARAGAGRGAPPRRRARGGVGGPTSGGSAVLAELIEDLPSWPPGSPGDSARRPPAGTPPSPRRLIIEPSSGPRAVEGHITNGASFSLGNILDGAILPAARPRDGGVEWQAGGGRGRRRDLWRRRGLHRGRAERRAARVRDRPDGARVSAGQPAS